MSPLCLSLSLSPVVDVAPQRLPLSLSEVSLSEVEGGKGMAAKQLASGIREAAGRQPEGCRHPSPEPE